MMYPAHHGAKVENLEEHKEIRAHAREVAFALQGVERQREHDGGGDDHCLNDRGGLVRGADGGKQVALDAGEEEQDDVIRRVRLREAWNAHKEENEEEREPHGAPQKRRSALDELLG